MNMITYTINIVLIIVIISAILYLALRRSYVNRLSRYILNRFKTDNNYRFSRI